MRGHGHQARLVAGLAAAAMLSSPASASDYHQPFGPGGGICLGSPAACTLAEHALDDRARAAARPETRGEERRALPPAGRAPISDGGRAPASDGFDWADAGVGFAGGTAAVLLSAVTLGLASRRRGATEEDFPSLLPRAPS